MLEGPDLVHQPLPLDHAILWKPAVGGGGTGLIPDPIFVTQAAVAALREHAGTAPEKSLLGFLIGDLCEAPDSAARYILVGSTIRVTQPVQGDRTTIVLKALWDRVRAEVKKRGNHLLGWYHTHQALGIELSSYDVETHERYFTEPWQVAVVVGTAEGEPAAGFFRPGVDENWAATCLPFYEVLKDESLGESGKKRSYVVWKNYRAFNAASDRTTRVMSAPRADAIPPPPPPRRSAPHATPPAAPPPPRPAPSPPAAEPEARDEEPEDRGELRFLTAADDMLRPPAPPPPRFPPPPSRPSVPGLVGDDAFATDQGKIPSVPRRSGAEPRPEAAAPTASARRTAPHAIPRRARRRWSRVVGVGLALLVAVGGGGALYWQFGSQLLHRREAPVSALRRALHPPPAVPAPSSPALVRLDALADSLAQAVRNYNDRMRLFDRRQLDCLGLGRGMVTVEAKLVAYDVRRVALRGTLDAGRASREQALRASVDDAERRFRRSQCRRP